MVPPRSQLRGRRPHSTAALCAAAGLAVLAASKFARAFVSGGPLGAQRAPQQTVVAAGQGAKSAAPPKLWTLAMIRSDHYIWRDEHTFVGIVTDAGEYEIEVDAVKAAFKRAQVSGRAEVFSAPLYVVKDYVRELESYGLLAEAIEAAEGAEEGWSQRDWRGLSPEAKEAREGGVDAPVVGKMRVVVSRSDHSTFESSDGVGKFRAYVELAADAARRFTPSETTLNAVYERIRRGGREAVLESLPAEAAEVAAKQLRKAGFTVETEDEEAMVPAE